MNNLPNLIHRLRRVASGESVRDVYGKDDWLDTGIFEGKMSFVTACFDKTPITESVLRKFGFDGDWEGWTRDGDEFVLAKDKDRWIITADGYSPMVGSVTTRGQLIQLLSALGVWDGA